MPSKYYYQMDPQKYIEQTREWQKKNRIKRNLTALEYYYRNKEIINQKQREKYRLLRKLK